MATSLPPTSLCPSCLSVPIREVGRTQSLGGQDIHRELCEEGGLGALQAPQRQWERAHRRGCHGPAGQRGASGRLALSAVAALCQAVSTVLCRVPGAGSARGRECQAVSSAADRTFVPIQPLPEASASFPAPVRPAGREAGSRHRPLRPPRPPARGPYRPRSTGAAPPAGSGRWPPGLPRACASGSRRSGQSPPPPAACPPAALRAGAGGEGRGGGGRRVTLWAPGGTSAQPLPSAVGQAAAG